LRQELPHQSEGPLREDSRIRTAGCGPPHSFTGLAQVGQELNAQQGVRGVQLSVLLRLSVRMT